jgi:hypothetical protein
VLLTKCANAVSAHVDGQFEQVVHELLAVGDGQHHFLGQHQFLVTELMLHLDL